MSGHRIETTDLTISYDKEPAVQNVTSQFEPDRIHGLLGRNGAGKTTMLSALASLRLPTSGQIRIAGQQPFDNEQVMQDVCLIRESGDVLTEEKIKTNLDWFELARPRFDRAYAEDLLDRFELPLNKKINSLSRGQASAFGVVAGLAARTPVTMFDEVHLGMDAPSRQLFYDLLLADFAEHPRTFILSSHLISEIEHLLETVTILHRGRLLLTDEAETVREQGATLTGPAARVDALAATLPVIGVRDLGPTREVTVYGVLDDEKLAAAERDGLHVGPVPLQELFIHLTSQTTTAKEST